MSLNEHHYFVGFSIFGRICWLICLAVATGLMSVPLATISQQKENGVALVSANITVFELKAGLWGVCLRVDAGGLEKLESKITSAAVSVANKITSGAESVGSQVTSGAGSVGTDITSGGKSVAGDIGNAVTGAIHFRRSEREGSYDDSFGPTPTVTDFVARAIQASPTPTFHEFNKRDLGSWKCSGPAIGLTIPSFSVLGISANLPIEDSLKSMIIKASGVVTVMNLIAVAVSAILLMLGILELVFEFAGCCIDWAGPGKWKSLFLLIATIFAFLAATLSAGINGYGFNYAKKKLEGIKVGGDALDVAINMKPIYYQVGGAVIFLLILFYQIYDYIRARRRSRSRMGNGSNDSNLSINKY